MTHLAYLPNESSIDQVTQSEVVLYTGLHNTVGQSPKKMPSRDMEACQVDIEARHHHGDDQILSHGPVEIRTERF